jgi:hypothetical protein
LIHNHGDVGVLEPLVLAVFVIGVILFGFLQGGFKGSLHESILTHDHLSVDGSEFLSKHGDLLGRHIISIDEIRGKANGNQIMVGAPSLGLHNEKGILHHVTGCSWQFKATS